jgi:hypothetical protein
MTLVAGATDTPAHTRTGATFGGKDFPRMDPADVARTGLEWLGRAPLRAASDELQSAFDSMRALPIEQIIEFMSMGSRAIYGLDSQDVTLSLLREVQIQHYRRDLGKCKMCT